MEAVSELKIGIFNDDDKLDMKIKKEIFKQILDFILEYE